MHPRKRSRTGFRLFGILAAVIAGAICVPVPGSAFSDQAAPGVYTTIDFPFSAEHGATAINAAGVIIGNYGDPSGHGYVLRDGTASQIDYPGAPVGRPGRAARRIEAGPTAGRTPHGRGTGFSYPLSTAGHV